MKEKKSGPISTMSHEDIINSLSSIEKTVQVLRNFKMLKPSDSWLDEEIIVDTRRDYLTDDTEDIRRKRRKVVDNLSVEKAARRVVRYWSRPIVPPRYSDVAKQRSARIVGRKLVITWKGPHSAKTQMTVGRLNEDQYVVIRENKEYGITELF